jgi:hypothetical protein
LVDLIFLLTYLLQPVSRRTAKTQSTAKSAKNFLALFANLGVFA